MFNMIYM